ncbi:alpha/beta hydrolase fold domain-containing protein [Amycolatopsis sp. RM579]|uniref:Alpha/beta hydrolase fold domain-containing protein n=1 Tax=Amycolatopsis pithecellobii TaxID=664692 RepID=A0A6N7Z217_9PSEU|nr:alpha/beta hydrolase fold domain-containing protein [Amycolatopsis pithecellobii]
MRRRRPPLDPELGAVLASFPAEALASVSANNISSLRRVLSTQTADLRQIEQLDLIVDEYHAQAPDGAQVPLTVLRPRYSAGPVPCIYYIHGGGMIAGNRLLRVDKLAELVLELGVAVVSVEYRLAPEHPYPAGLHDCYAGLEWISSHACENGFDPDYLLVHGVSAGGGLAAGIALMARDFGGPQITHLILQAPMLDDRNQTPSSSELEGDAPWDRVSNVTGWSALLGDGAGGPDTSPYAAPSRAENLDHMPSTYIDVGQVETFRDEAIEFATRLAREGGLVEFHLWPGAWHGFDYTAPHAAVSQVSNQTRSAFIDRAVASSLNVRQRPRTAGPASDKRF